MKSKLKLPKTGKGWFSLILLLFVVFLGGWPVISWLNKPVIFLGMPILMFWSIFIIILTTFSMLLIDKIGGSDQ